MDSIAKAKIRQDVLLAQALIQTKKAIKNTRKLKAKIKSIKKDRIKKIDLSHSSFLFIDSKMSGKQLINKYSKL